MDAGRVRRELEAKAPIDRINRAGRLFGTRGEKPRTRTIRRERDTPLQGEMQQSDDNGVTLLVPSARIGSMEQRSLRRS